MGRFARPCLKCGVLTSGDSYCVEHKPVKADSIRRKQTKRERYDSTYQRLAKHVRDNAIACHLCGQGWRADDPWEADHIAPGEWGREYELAAAHRSCNIRRGNMPIELWRQINNTTPGGTTQSRAGDTHQPEP